MMMMTITMTISKMIAIVMIMMAIVATMTTVITTYYGDAIHGLLAWLAGLPANQDAITRMAGRPAGLLKQAQRKIDLLTWKQPMRFRANQT